MEAVCDWQMCPALKGAAGRKNSTLPALGCDHTINFQVVQPQKLVGLSRMVQEVMLRRLKREVMAQLPAKRRQVVRLPRPRPADWPPSGVQSSWPPAVLMPPPVTTLKYHVSITSCPLLGGASTGKCCIFPHPSPDAWVVVMSVGELPLQGVQACVKARLMSPLHMHMHSCELCSCVIVSQADLINMTCLHRGAKR